MSGPVCGIYGAEARDQHADAWVGAGPCEADDGGDDAADGLFPRVP